jgi:putative ABC transport system permease protein
MDLTRLVLKNLLKHPLRSVLTAGSLVIALFLLCTLRSLVTTLDAGAKAARSDRLWVQSAVSLFVDMPQAYVPKIEAVDGVVEACRWQWFGGYYQDRANFFGQFAVDGAELFEMYPEIEVVAGTQEDFLAKRTACMVGGGLARQFGWKVGQQVPIIGALFPHPDGADVAWDFELAAIYEPTARNFDDRTLFFHWDYFEETLEGSDMEGVGVGAIVIETAPDANQTRVMREVDALFANGPQRVQTTTEAEFQAQFVSMFGNIPFFVSAIGGGVLVAILFACVNTMLMAAREQTHDIGILKALGFTDGKTGRVLLAQSMCLCCLGGGGGVLLALALEDGVAKIMGAQFPGYEIEPSTLVQALVVTLAIGVVAGAFPAWSANRLRVVDALRGRD